MEATSHTFARRLLPGARILFLGVLLGAGLLTTHRSNTAVIQPIAFSHRKHVMEQGLVCKNCHLGASTQIYAGIPQTDTCVNCHVILLRIKPAKLVGKPELAKLKQYIVSSQGIPWHQVYTEPGYIFFSHRRHVAVAKLECAKCHGDIAHLNAPPTRVLVTQSMNWCVSCHQQRHASQDCISCHR